MKFGLMFFASSEEALSGDKYRLVIDSTRFADSNGFSSVWVPERHFTEFGSLYPNPAVLHAALAASTSRVRLLAGSVVAPLHHPTRIAEEWSMVDNLSNGRVGVSFASGWNPDDFVFCPEKYADRQNEMLTAIRTVQHLWRGGTIDGQRGNGEAIQVRIYPTPVQRELPIWLTAAGNPQTFIRAGEIGANLLTHVLDQDQDHLAEKIALYRSARSKNGLDPATGTVTVMLHTFVGSDAALVREQARAPFCNYIRRNAGLLSGLAQSRGQQIDVNSMPPRELDEFVQFLYERFAQSRGLIGTPESCLALVKNLEGIGVDEVACLLDFGPPNDLILENLPHLLRLRDLCQKTAPVTMARFDPALVQARCPQQTPGAEFNSAMRAYGIHIDGEFQAIEQIWRTTGEALGKISLPVNPSSSSKYEIHPAFLDACSRVLAGAIDWKSANNDGFYLPTGVGALRIHHQPAGRDAWSHAVLRESALVDTLQGDVRIYDVDGRLLIEIEELRLQRVHSGQRPQHDFSSMLYRREWKPLDSESYADGGPGGEWLIFADRQGVGARFAAVLKEAGNTCSLIFADSAPEDHSVIDGRLQGIIHLWSLDLAPSDVEGRKSVSANVLRIIKALVPANASPQPRLWLVTSGAMPVLEGEAPAVAQSPLWGLGNAIAVEHPTIWGGLIDLDPADLTNSAVLRVVRSSDAESMIAVRQGRRYVARIVRDERELSNARSVEFKNDATYLVAGGLGGLGLRLASWLLEHGAGQVALLGRNAPTPEAAKILQDTRARVIIADLSRRNDIAEAIREIKRSMLPLKGIFHLAGTLDDARLLDQDADRFYRAGTGKAEGALNLHELTSDVPLDHFVLFSSMASLVTMPGQGNYASANIFLDALAHLRRAEGKPALSINWGPWAEIGHAATEYGRRAHGRLATLGVQPLSPDLAIASLEVLMASQVTQAGVANVDWPRLIQADPALAASPLLSQLLQSANAPVQEETPLVSDLRSCAPNERRDLVMSALAEMVAEVLRLPDPGSILPTQSVFDLGMDSIIVLELTNRIAFSFGRPFRATLFFTHPTLEGVADHILTELAPTLGDGVLRVGSNDDLTEEELSELIAQEIGSR
jgi:phthiocerol/phenolphthiocerol synthesis type-I polyketide synthase D